MSLFGFGICLLIVLGASIVSQGCLNVITFSITKYLLELPSLKCSVCDLLISLLLDLLAFISQLTTCLNAFWSSSCHLRGLALSAFPTFFNSLVSV